MSKFHVVIYDDRYSAYEQEREVLAEVDASFEVVRSHELAEMAPPAPRADGVLVNLNPVPAALIERLERCRVISRYGVGYDNVDVAAATGAGILVANVPDFCWDEVADTAMSLILCATRKVAMLSTRIKSGQWDRASAIPIHKYRGSTLGLLAFGNIARAVARRAIPFGFSVIAHDPYVDPASVVDQPVELVPFDDPAQIADVRIATRVNGETRQDDRTGRMLFPVARQIAYISTFTTLVPGDIIVTGTPTGAGARFDPPRFLVPGDIVEVEAEGIGVLRNTVADE